MELYKEPSQISSSSIHTASHAITHMGNVRTRNEDAILDLSSESLWVVADGMGGHDAGDFASQCIISHLSTFKLQDTLSKNIDLIEEKVIAANEDIQSHARKTKIDKTKTSGSTIVGLFIWKNIGLTFWAGDSRLYRFTDSLNRITEDHSYVEELIKMGQLSADEAEEHPSANIILNAVGIRDKHYLDMDYIQIEDNDVFILCSDGLYKDINESALSDIIKNKIDNMDMEYLSTELLNAALAAGGTDNTSVICIKTLFRGDHHV